MNQCKKILILLAAMAAFASTQVDAQYTNVNVGTTNNDGTGDPLRTAFIKINTNFAWVTNNLQFLSDNRPGTNSMGGSQLAWQTYTNPITGSYGFVSSNASYHIVRANIGTNFHTGMIMSNATPANSTTNQNSPGLWYFASVWTGATNTYESVGVASMLTPITSGTNADGWMGWYYQTNTATNAGWLPSAFGFRLGSGFVGIGKTNPATILDINGTATATLFAGSGASLTALAAAQLTGSHTLPDAVLSTNAPLLNASQHWGSQQFFDGGFAGTGTSLGVSGTATINTLVLTNALAIAYGGLGNGTGSGASLNNVSLSDGGNIINSRNALGSTAGMNAGTGWIVYVNGSAGGYGAGGDNAFLIDDLSTNFFDNSGIGQTERGYGASGGSLLGLTQGPTFGYIRTNSSHTFINSVGEIVMNYDANIAQGFYICSPGGGTIAPDSGNYGYMACDWKDSLFGVPLIPSANGGCYKASDNIYDFPCSGVTNAPGFPVGYVDSSGHIFTSYTNSGSSGSVHCVMTGSSGAPPANGTLTKISTGTGDATLTYTSAVLSRSWNGWAMAVFPGTGVVNVWSNLNLGGSFTLTNGTFSSIRPHVNNGTTNVNPFATVGNLDLRIGASDGLAGLISRGQESLLIGQGGHPIASLSFNNWNGINSFDVGGDELGDDINNGNALFYVHGSFGDGVTNRATSYTPSAQNDHTIVVTATGQTITLPDATSHCKGRYYTVVLTASGSCTVATTSSQNINGATTYSLSAQYKYVTVQSDGTQWWIVANN